MDNQFQPKDNEPVNGVDQPGETIQPGMKPPGVDSATNPPKPFTMDSPTEPTQAGSPPPQSPSQSTEPELFTMDNQASSAHSSPTPQAPQASPEPLSNSASRTIDGVNAGSVASSTPQNSSDSRSNIQPGQSPTSASQQPNLSPENAQATQSLVQDPVVQPAAPMPSAADNQSGSVPPVAPVAPQPGSLTADQSAHLPGQPTSTHLGVNQKNSGKKQGWKKRAPLIAIVLFFVGAIAGVFGYYIPNRPENVYRTGLDRTGQMMSQLDEQFAAIDEIASSDGFQMDGSINTQMEEGTISGTMSSRAGESSSETNIDVSGEIGDDSFGMNINLGFDIITDIVEGNEYPDVFFKVRGGELLSMISPQIAQYDEQWVHAEASFIEETLSELIDDFESEDEGAAEGWLELIDDLGDVVADYVLTSDEKGILELDEIVGAEERNDTRTYRYNVSINRDNTEEFCTELFDTIGQSSFVQSQLSSTIELNDEDRDNQISDCVASFADFYDDVDITMWIDRSTKLIHQLRFEDDDGFTLEVGQTYDGSDKFDLFINAFDDEMDMRLTITVNNAAPSVAVNLDIELEEMADDDEFTMQMSVEPFDESVEIERPSDTITLEQLIDQLMAAFFFPQQPTDSMMQPGFDTEFDAQLGDDFTFDEPPVRGQPGFLETFQDILSPDARSE